ncbi:MAG: diaminopimelate dehydrogenase [Clostridia bacterium]|nr:diaminopimelate dehydrogenase [Clostridia bacterium]
MIRLAIWGYGNLGRGVELAIRQNPDMELTGIYTRRDPKSVVSPYGTPSYAASDIYAHADEIDAVIICGGSATDLMPNTPLLAKAFNVIDSFDTHAFVEQHYANVDAAAKEGGKVGVISCGWDPGLFSLARVYALAALPEGSTYTFWGRGVSQGHSDAIRRIPGVVDARQYTVPVPAAVESVHTGESPVFVTRDMHTRECFVVAEEGADKAAIENAIKTMPNYFADYDTTVTFVTEEELLRDHAELPHGGHVIRSGFTGADNRHHETIDFALKLDSNPEFTAGVLVACARAAVRMNARGESGARTILDIAPRDLVMPEGAELRKMI